MTKLSYLNVGCGDKFHPLWTNIDMHPSSPDVRAHDLRKGFPFHDDTFEVIYHSQVLEHFQKEDASCFMRECFRTLKPGGILRVVVPDLENIAREYLRLLDENVQRPSPTIEADYDWILLEMYDQTVRNQRGGEMQRFIGNPGIINESYVTGRVGQSARSLLASAVTAASRKNFSFSARHLTSSLLNLLSRLIPSRAWRVGSFRLEGEVHMWMYDRFSLSRLLRVSGFEGIELRAPLLSGIPRWAEYELDAKNGLIFDPTSLFMEARKPARGATASTDALDAELS